MRRKVWTYMIHTKRREAGCGRSLRDPHIKGGCCFNSLFILHSSHFISHSPFCCSLDVLASRSPLSALSSSTLYALLSCYLTLSFPLSRLLACSLSSALSLSCCFVQPPALSRSLLHTLSLRPSDFNFTLPTVMVMIPHLNMVLYSCERQMHTGRRVPRRWWQQFAEKPEIMLLDRAAVTKTTARPCSTKTAVTRTAAKTVTRSSSCSIHIYISTIHEP